MTPRICKPRLSAAPRHPRRRLPSFAERIAVGWLLLGGCGLAAAFERARVPELDSAMFHDPSLGIPASTLSVPATVQPLWLRALRSDEDELKRQAAFSIAWACHRGLTEWDDAVDPLVHNLTRDPNRLVRLASAHALVTLDARQSADALFRQSREDGLEMAQVVEPALARWDYGPVRAVWRQRLELPRQGHQYLALAIRGLGRVRDAGASEILERFVGDPHRPATLRLVAADSLGQTRREGLEAVARRMMQDPATLIERLAAAKLLRFHDSQAARELLVALAEDPASSVAGLALERLREVEPQRILPLAESLLQQGDSNVRRSVVEALIACPSESAAFRLGPLLSDPHPGVRRRVRGALIQLAQSGALADAVLMGAEAALEGEDWRGQEQAIHLLAGLRQTSHAERFLQLLEHPRPEVHVTAAWGLRQLAVPETLKPCLQFAQDRFEARPAVPETPAAAGVDAQLAQLFQFFGQAGYAPAEEFLIRFVPRVPDLDLPRAAALWALGYLHSEDPPESLIRLLEDRLRDTQLPEPEAELVRRFSAVSLGRMKARSTLETLRQYRGTDPIETKIQYASAWAIQQITGEAFQKPLPGRRRYGQFFLEPYTGDTP